MAKNTYLDIKDLDDLDRFKERLMEGARVMDGRSFMMKYRYDVRRIERTKKLFGGWKPEIELGPSDEIYPGTEHLPKGGITVSDEIVCFYDQAEENGFKGKTAEYEYGHELTVTVSESLSAAYCFFDKVVKGHDDIVKALREGILREEASAFRSAEMRFEDMERSVHLRVGRGGVTCGSEEYPKTVLLFERFMLPPLDEEAQRTAMGWIVRNLVHEICAQRGYKIKYSRCELRDNYGTYKPVYVDIRFVIPANTAYKQW